MSIHREIVTQFLISCCSSASDCEAYIYFISEHAACNVYSMANTRSQTSFLNANNAQAVRTSRTSWNEPLAIKKVRPRYIRLSMEWRMISKRKAVVLPIGPSWAPVSYWLK